MNLRVSASITMEPPPPPPPPPLPPLRPHGRTERTPPPLLPPPPLRPRLLRYPSPSPPPPLRPGGDGTDDVARPRPRHLLGPEDPSSSCQAPRHRCSPSDNLPSTSRAASTPPRNAHDLHAMAPRRRCPPLDNLNWYGPGLHRFNGLEDLLLSVGDLNRFLTRREGLCILQNALFFINNGTLNDASDDPRRCDFEILIINRLSFLQMVDRAGASGKYWPGYKEDYFEMSEEKRISTLKLNENTFLWRHEVSGKRLLRRRISLDKDEGPFEDESQVFYILQYQKLPRMKKSEKAKILAERAERGHF